jgi:AcrR family transcriptional regulator
LISAVAELNDWPQKVDAEGALSRCGRSPPTCAATSMPSPPWLTLTYRSGPVEGTANRTKMIKRQSGAPASTSSTRAFCRYLDDGTTQGAPEPEGVGCQRSASTLRMVTTEPKDAPEKDREERILDAVLSLLSRQGISGISMRAVAREAGVALGLVNYYYEDKTGLISAALRRIGEQDVALVESDPLLPAEDRLRAALLRVAKPEFLTIEYLSLRLQLWALAQAHEDFAHINAEAQKRYRAGLARLIRAVRPNLSRSECNKRAADVDVVQNGMWLTALLGLDRASIRRAVRLSEEIALAP